MDADATHNCSGFKSLEGVTPVKCDQGANPYLWYLHEGHEYYFCKASHLMRNLVEYYGRQGKCAKKSNQELAGQLKANSKKRKSNHKEQAATAKKPKGKGDNTNPDSTTSK